MGLGARHVGPAYRTQLESKWTAHAHHHHHREYQPHHHEGAAQLTVRGDLLTLLARRIAQTQVQPVTFVGVDGVDGAGKTLFADELSRELERCSQPVIRATVDGFHNPRSHRYRQGRHSPRGFFEDSYNYSAMCQLLLDPLTSSGSGRYCSVAFDLKGDVAVEPLYATAQAGSVLIVDGIFLHREELRAYWHFSVWLQTSFDVSVSRLALRDGNPPDPADAANARYVEGQRLYMTRCHPQAHATLVVNNDDLARPFIADHGD